MNSTQTKKTNFSDLLRDVKVGHSKSQEENLIEAGDWARQKKLNPHLTDAQVRENIEIIRQRAEHDLLLYKTQYGTLAISNHMTFPRTFNASANVLAERGKIEVIRPLWLGKGSTFVFNKFVLKKAKNAEEIESFISTTLVNQIIEMVLLYKENVEMTPRELLLKEEKTGQSVHRVFYEKQFDFAYEHSSYTHSLVKNLAEWMQRDFPESWEFVRVPEFVDYLQWTGAVLTAQEYNKIKDILKTGAYYLPAQIKQSKAKIDSDLIKNTNEELLKEISFLREKISKLENKEVVENRENLELGISEIQMLKEEYKEKFGRFPPHNISLENLKKQITKEIENG